METIKNIAAQVPEQAGGPGERQGGVKIDDSSRQAPKGAFAQPEDYPTESQKGSRVGIQGDMVGKPAPATMQEGDKDFTWYKAAGKMQGKKTIVTGGDSGIGRAVAAMFAMEGADVRSVPRLHVQLSKALFDDANQVAIVYLPEEQRDAEAAKSIVTASGGQCLLFPQDIRDEAGCKRVIDSVVQAWGRIDVLVNNASVMYSIPDIADVTTDQFDLTMKTNVYGTFYMTKHAVPHIPKGGSIIVTASQVAYAGPPMLLDYSMTKGAQVAMVRVLSNQLLSKGIRVNAVCPGPVWTPLQAAAMTDDQMKEWHSSPAPIGRIGQPGELGPAYVFLASADGSFISGQSIHVNGGAIVSG